MHAEQLFVVLFSIATAVAIGARWLKIPYTVALVVTGLAIGSAHALEAPHLTKELLFAVILPGLVFEAAFHLDAQKFWHDRFAIAALAVPGLVAAVLITAAILAPIADALAVSGFTLIHAMVFASVIVATDPIAVVALLRSLGAPGRLSVLVEGESLINDGTGVVLFTLVVAGATAGTFSAAHAAVGFVRIAGLGAFVGAVVGYGISQLIRRIDDAMVELTLTIIAAYGSFMLAERLQASGVIATVAAGMLCGNYAARVGMSPTTRVAVETAWEYLAFALNSIVFLLIGFEVKLDSLLAAWKPVVAAFFAVLVARAAVVALVTALLRRSRRRIPWAWGAAITWSGLRGALSMVLVLGLAADFPHRALIVNMTFGVVVLSILAQGLTMAPLLRRLGLASSRSAARRSHELEYGRLQAASAALAEIDDMRREHVTSAALLDAFEGEYGDRAEAAEKAMSDLHLGAVSLRAEELRAARRRLLIAERDAVLRGAHKGLLGPDALGTLLADVDARLEAVDGEAPTRSDAGVVTEVEA
jgi:CPA1 family monovalent cation:H+ antiporter